MGGLLVMGYGYEYGYGYGLGYGYGYAHDYGYDWEKVRSVVFSFFLFLSALVDCNAPFSGFLFSASFFSRKKL